MGIYQAERNALRNGALAAREYIALMEGMIRMDILPPGVTRERQVENVEIMRRGVEVLERMEGDLSERSQALLGPGDAP